MRYKRLNYRTKSAQDILQMKTKSISQMFIITGVNHFIFLCKAWHINRNISIYILVGETTARHNKAFAIVLKKLREYCITVNSKKCLFDVPEVNIFGSVFNKDEIKPNPKHLPNLHETSPLLRKSDILWHLGIPRKIHSRLWHFDCTPKGDDQYRQMEMGWKTTQSTRKCESKNWWM